MKAAIIGASGITGQQFMRILANHPMFELTNLYASERSEGLKVQEIWKLPFFDCPENLFDREIENLKSLSDEVDIVFSALPKSVAQEYEHRIRLNGVRVFSNAGSHRMDDDVPILIPEINGEQIELVRTQQDRYNTDGFIITNSNCSAAGAATYLYEVNKNQVVDTAVISTYQALSGAGIDGVAALDINGNVIPYIANEESKIIAETKKMLGNLVGDKIVPHPMNVIANAARVNVSDGHLEAISCIFREQVKPEIIDNLNRVRSPLDLDKHFIAPMKHLSVFSENNRPQPKLDVFRSDENHNSKGMTVHCGRLRAIQNSLSSFVLVHNTIRGGAGGSVLNAEYAISKGYM